MLVAAASMAARADQPGDRPIATVGFGPQGILIILEVSTEKEDAAI